MPRISVTEANQALVNTGWSFVSLHTADPGTTGASELSGGSYARVAVAWNAAASGARTNSGALSINIPATTTVTYFGVWSLVSGGVYYIGGALSPSVTSTTAGLVTIAAGALSVTAS
jgi:hypothetical protein